MDELQAYRDDHSDVAGNRRWTVDRQFRLALGLVLLVSLAGTFMREAAWLAPVSVIAVGLTVTALIDRCYAREAIARLPWNREAK